MVDIVQTRCMSPRLAFAIETAKLAGDSTLEHFRGSRGFELKDNLTPVTAADLAAESLVRSRIEKEYPREAILGEEQGGDESVPDRWVVDPIDGTKSFVCGVPLYASLLSFESDRQPVVGVAYFPALGETIYAELGQGAFWNGRPCAVSENSDLSRATVCCGGHGSMEKTGRTAGLLALSKRVMATRTWCDAYGHFLVATGKVDAMIDPSVSRWDISALALIVREAGGRFTDFAGQDGLSSEAVSVTPQLFEPVLGAFRG